MITSLKATNFSGFKSLDLSFAQGINVIIGENGTGKTHLLKLLYSAHEALREPVKSGGALLKEQTSIRLLDTLDGVFRPDEHDVGHLVKRSAGGAQVVVRFSGTTVNFVLSSEGGLTTVERTGTLRSTSTFIPSREVLTLAHGGFAGIWSSTKALLDQTYYDACVALERPPLNADALGAMHDVVAMAGKAIGVQVAREKGRFYLVENKRKLDVQLVAEGWRKLGAVTQLIANGTIAKGSILLWDEPEANLNPVLIRSVSSLLVALAQYGVQVFVASHDYLLTQTLSLESEYPKRNSPEMKFIGLSRTGRGGLEVQEGETIADLTENPIVREHARQYDVEMDAIARTARATRTAPRQTPSPAKRVPKKRS